MTPELRAHDFRTRALASARQRVPLTDLSEAKVLSEALDIMSDNLARSMIALEGAQSEVKVLSDQIAAKKAEEAARNADAAAEGLASTVHSG